MLKAVILDRAVLRAVDANARVEKQRQVDEHGQNQDDHDGVTSGASIAIVLCH